MVAGRGDIGKSLKLLKIVWVEFAINGSPHGPGGASGPCMSSPQAKATRMSKEKVTKRPSLAILSLKTSPVYMI